MKTLRKVFAIILTLTTLFSVVAMTGCSDDREAVIIYTSAEDYRIEYLNSRLKEEFPQYNIKIEYMSTGNLAAKIKAEGKDTECDIIYDMDYGYMMQLEKENVFANLKGKYDTSKYTDDAIISDYFLPEIRNGGAVIVNVEMLEEKGIAVPTCYADLLKPEYKDLISMPNPKTSGTGYMFLKSLVNAMGEEAAFDYFKKLSVNVVEFTSSGSGPVENLKIKETAIGLGMTADAVKANNDGGNFQILYFEEGSPYSLYGQTIIAGREEKAAVKEIFDFMINTYSDENLQKFYPEQIYKDKTFEIENYPKNINYADMSNNSYQEKERLLKKWSESVN